VIRTQAKVRAVPSPTEKHRYTGSGHPISTQDSREHFEMRVVTSVCRHRRAQPKNGRRLQRLDLPAASRSNSDPGRLASLLTTSEGVGRSVHRVQSIFAH